VQDRVRMQRADMAAFRVRGGPDQRAGGRSQWTPFGA